MECWLFDLVDSHRARIEPEDEGALWLTFVAFDGTATTAAVEGATEHVDEQMLTSLTRVVDGAGAEAVVLVVPRRDGRPRAVDRRLWRELVARTDPRTDVVDLLVIGERTSRSLADEVAEAEDEPWDHDGELA